MRWHVMAWQVVCVGTMDAVVISSPWDSPDCRCRARTTHARCNVTVTLPFIHGSFGRSQVRDLMVGFRCIHILMTRFWDKADARCCFQEAFTGKDHIILQLFNNNNNITFLFLKWKETFCVYIEVLIQSVQYYFYCWCLTVKMLLLIQFHCCRALHATN